MANASALRAQADELEEIDRRSIELLVVRTGLPRQVVASWFDGEDHTFSAGEAISAGLADALVEPEDD
jgi:ATP-dependent protease ClpP protease subunit